MKCKIKNIFFLLLMAFAIVVTVVIVQFVWDAVLILKENIKITDAKPFPEWNQKDMDYLQQLTGVKLPQGTVLLAHSNNYEGRRQDASWLIFSKEKITFPWILTDNIMSTGWEKDTFIERCRAKKAQSKFSIEGEIQSCLSSYKSYNGKGNDVFVEMKTSKGYYVRIEYCRVRRGVPVRPDENAAPYKAYYFYTRPVQK
ncbi:MAG: hypothetical protein WCV67_01400 [Victivallaceae bacterium]|jgi:hypothetical protein